MSFSTPYLWTAAGHRYWQQDGAQALHYGAVAETFVFYTTRSTSAAGSVEKDCEPISAEDFDQCPNWPKIPCWPPKVTTPNLKQIQRWNK